MVTEGWFRHRLGTSGRVLAALASLAFFMSAFRIELGHTLFWFTVASILVGLVGTRFFAISSPQKVQA